MVYSHENFAHGSVTLGDKCVMYYPITEFYIQGYERGIRFNKTAFKIEWPQDMEFASEKTGVIPILV